MLLAVPGYNYVGKRCKPMGKRLAATAPRAGQIAVRMEGGVSPTSSARKQEHHAIGLDALHPPRVSDEKRLIVCNQLLQLQGTWCIDVFGAVGNDGFDSNGPESPSVHLTRVCPPPFTRRWMSMLAKPSSPAARSVSRTIILGYRGPLRDTSHNPA